MTGPRKRRASLKSGASHATEVVDIREPKVKKKRKASKEKYEIIGDTALTTLSAIPAVKALKWMMPIIKKGVKGAPKLIKSLENYSNFLKGKRPSNTPSITKTTKFKVKKRKGSRSSQKLPKSDIFEKLEGGEGYQKELQRLARIAQQSIDKKGKVIKHDFTPKPKRKGGRLKSDKLLGPPLTKKKINKSKKKKFKVRPSFKIHGHGKGPTKTREASITPEIDVAKNTTIIPKVRNLKIGKDGYREKERGIRFKMGDVHISGSRTKASAKGITSLPDKRAIKFAIDNILGGKIEASGSRQGRKKEGKIEYRVDFPIKDVPILNKILGYKRKGVFKRKSGGRLNKPRGIGKALRGYGKAMKHGK